MANCRPVNAESGASRPSFSGRRSPATSALAPPVGIAKLKLTGHLNFRGRHLFESPAISVQVSAVGIHQPPQLQRLAFTSHLRVRSESASQPSQFQRSGQVRFIRHPMSRQPSKVQTGIASHWQMSRSQFQSDLAAAATSPQQAPALGSAAATEVPTGRGKAASTYHH